MKGATLPIFSLLLALGLWYFVNSEGNHTIVSFQAPIQVLNLPSTQVVTSQNHRQAQVTVKGPAFLVAKLASNPPILKVPAPKEGESRMVVPLLKSELDLPKNVQIASIEPSEVRFTFDRVVQRVVPVVVPRIGALGESLIIRSVEISPSEVEIRGPESEIQRLLNVETYPLDFRQITNDHNQSIGIRLPDSLIESDVDKVEVNVDVERVLLEREFLSIPVVVRNLEGVLPFRANPAEVSVVLSGPRDDIRGLGSDKIKAFVNAVDAIEGKAYGIVIEAPKGISTVRIKPDSVRITRATAGGNQLKKKS